MENAQFQPGFRISVLDAIVVLAGVFGTIFVGMKVWYAGFIIGFAVFHFFMFCNIFRMSRIPELIWASLFVALSSMTLTLEVPSWPVAIGISLLASSILIALEMRKPSYHGFGWQRINPNLKDWWNSKIKNK